jgi:beta-lactamase class A
MNQKSIIFTIASLIFVVGFILGFFVKCINPPIVKDRGEEKRLRGYKYISPLLECENIENINKEIIPFKIALVDLVDKGKIQYDITHTSVYFRDLNNGPWIGINETEEFSPASMLKVPMMMSIFKLAEANKTILQENIKVTMGNSTIEQFFQPPDVIKNGNSYTIEDLVSRMIVNSDNSALNELYNFIGSDLTFKLYSDIGLSVINMENKENFMSVKNYASFFRILYNASYLNKEFSEKSLELLANVSFKNGLRAGVPENIVIAHKFGERIIDATRENQLHDCGIVYYPNRPYLLCIMNRGKDFSKMSDFIKKISEFVYNEVNKQYN